MISSTDIHRLSRRMEGMRSSAIRDLLSEVGKEDVVSLAGGLPRPSSSHRALREILSEVLQSTDGPQALQYGSTEGCQRCGASSRLTLRFQRGRSGKTRSS